MQRTPSIKAGLPYFPFSATGTLGRISGKKSSTAATRKTFKMSFLYLFLATDSGKPFPNFSSDHPQLSASLKLHPSFTIRL